MRAVPILLQYVHEDYLQRSSVFLPLLQLTCYTMSYCFRHCYVFLLRMCQHSPISIASCSAMFSPNSCGEGKDTKRVLISFSHKRDIHILGYSEVNFNVLAYVCLCLCLQYRGKLFLYIRSNVYLLFGILRFSATMKHIFASFS